MVPVPVVRLDPQLPLPTYAHPGDAGLDLHAREGAVVKAGGGRTIVPTGIALAIPPGYAGFVQPRSGLALRHGVTCLNTPGTIDADYRGEIAVLLINLGAVPHSIRRGDRIAQIVIARVAQQSWEEVSRLSESERGAGGFGSTGTR